MITIQDLHYSHRRAAAPALRGVDLTVPPGCLFGLLGPNGAGKTTLLSVLCGLLPVPPGVVTVAGYDIATEPGRVRALLALIPQEYAFYPSLTVAENLGFFAGVLGFYGATRRQRIDEVVAVAGLDGKLDTRAEHCSGGLRRRLNIAIGLLGKPRLLLLDEPTVGIDPQSRRFILDAIRAINRSGTTVIYTSHYMEEVQALCDQIAIIDEGRVLLRGALQDVLFEASAGTAVDVTLAEPPADRCREALLAAGCEVTAPLHLRVAPRPGESVVQLLTRLEAHGAAVAGAQPGARDLEALFIRLTRRSLRD